MGILFSSTCLTLREAIGICLGWPCKLIKNSFCFSPLATLTNVRAPAKRCKKVNSAPDLACLSVWCPVNKYDLELYA